MEEIKIPYHENKELTLKVTKGHFSSDRFHVNYYIDMTSLKMRQAEAKMVAEAMAEKYMKRIKLGSGVGLRFLSQSSMVEMGTIHTPIDTIICMDGCEMIGAYLAEALLKNGYHKPEGFNVITPEFDHSGQMIVRSNIKNMIRGRHVLVVLATAMSGKTISKALGTILAYGGKVSGLSVIFSKIDNVDGYPVNGIFTSEDLPDFKLCDPNDCEYCKAGQKLDAVVNSYGYELF